MNAEGFAVRGALVADSSLCPSRLFRKDLRTRNTTSIVTTRNATPSPAAIIHRCCVLPAFSPAANISPSLRLLSLSTSSPFIFGAHPLHSSPHHPDTLYSPPKT